MQCLLPNAIGHREAEPPLMHCDGDHRNESNLIASSKVTQQAKLCTEVLQL